MLNYLIITILLSLFVATLIKSLIKWGWFDWYETYKPKFLLWCKPCLFCFGFRISFIICIILAIIIKDYYVLLIPFCSASLINKII